MSVLRFSTEEAAVSLWRRRRANVVSLLTITAALFVLGGFLIVNANLQRWTAAWTAAAELSVYLADGAAPAEQAAVGEALAASAIVREVEFVGHDEALRRFRRLFPDLAEAAEHLGDRPLPASFEARLAMPRPTDEAVAALADELQALPAVTDVRYDRRWIERLTAIAEAARLAGLALAGVLIAAAALTVAGVIRLALHARQHEVEIMQLVGAPLGYIRGPFILEGILHGGVGAMLALAALYVLFAGVRAAAGGWLADVTGPDTTLVFMPWTAAAALLAGGMLVGCAGGFIAARSAR